MSVECPDVKRSFSGRLHVLFCRLVCGLLSAINPTLKYLLPVSSPMAETGHDHISFTSNPNHFVSSTVRKLMLSLVGFQNSSAILSFN